MLHELLPPVRGREALCNTHVRHVVQTSQATPAAARCRAYQGWYELCAKSILQTRWEPQNVQGRSNLHLTRPKCRCSVLAHHRCRWRRSPAPRSKNRFASQLPLFLSSTTVDKAPTQKVIPLPMQRSKFAQGGTSWKCCDASRIEKNSVFVFNRIDVVPQHEMVRTGPLILICANSPVQ